MTMAITRTNGRLATALDQMRQRYISRRANMTEARARKAKYQQTLTELNALSNRDLADIGIPRADIPRIAREELMKDWTK